MTCGRCLHMSGELCAMCILLKFWWVYKEHTVQIQIPTYKKYQANFDSLAIRRDDIVRRRSCQKVANLLNFFDSLSLFCSLHLFQPSLAKNRKTWQNVTTFNLFMKISSSRKCISIWSQMNLIVVVRGVNVYVPTVCMSPVLFHCQRLMGQGRLRYCTNSARHNPDPPHINV